MAAVPVSSVQAGAVSSFIPSFGGYVSKNAQNGTNLRRCAANADMSRGAYGEALRAQIAEDALRRRCEKQNNGDKPAIGLPVGSEYSPRGARKMGQRLGGPMTPVVKETYALALREQMAARAAANAESVDKVGSAQGLLGEAMADDTARPQGKRCAGPVALEPKAEYASYLQDQIAAQDAARRAALLAEQTPAPPGEPGAAARVGPDRGRRKVGTPLTKESYASELQEEIARRAMQRGADLRQVNEEPNGVLGVGQVSDVPMPRGRRRQEQMDHLQRDALGDALRLQIADRAADRAAEAFHLQPQEQAPDPPRAAKRRVEPVQPNANKQAYAAELQMQVQERNARVDAMLAQDAAKMADFLTPGCAAPPRGRRHAARITPASKASYGIALQEQISTREAQRAAEAFHLQAESDASSPKPVFSPCWRPLPMTNETALVPSKRHVVADPRPSPNSVSSPIWCPLQRTKETVPPARDALVASAQQRQKPKEISWGQDTLELFIRENSTDARR